LRRLAGDGLRRPSRKCNTPLEVGSLVIVVVGLRVHAAALDRIQKHLHYSAILT